MEKDFGNIAEQIFGDADINIEKIKKAFKNVINAKKFLANYERIKKGNPNMLGMNERDLYEIRID